MSVGHTPEGLGVPAAVGVGGNLEDHVTRAEHLAWCKRRAIEAVDSGDLAGAVASMTSGQARRDRGVGHPDVDVRRDAGRR